MQYQTLRSVSDNHLFVVCRDGKFYDLPDNVRHRGPGRGCIAANSATSGRSIGSILKIKAMRSSGASSRCSSQRPNADAALLPLLPMQAGGVAEVFCPTSHFELKPLAS